MSPYADDVDAPTHDHPRTTRWRRLVGAAVAAVLAAATVVLVPADDGQTAPRHNLRCDELIDGIEGVAEWADLPGGGLPDGHTTAIDDYEFSNPAEKLRGREEPTTAELEKLTGSHKDYEPGTEDHMLRRWKIYQGSYSWDSWRNVYIPAVSADGRGDGFHRVVARALRTGGEHWICEDTNLAKEKNLPTNRRYDAVNRQHRIAYELKSGNSPLSMDQLRADRALRAQGWRVVYVFSQEPRPGQVRLLQQYGVMHSVQRSAGINTNPPKPVGNALDPNRKNPTNGPVKDLASRSGRTPAEANENRRIQAAVERDLRRPGFRAQRPGGIDWTSLELRYVSDDPASDDLGYAFSADEVPDDAEPGHGGEASLNLSSDALFTWLALDPNQFWVNLNPDTPETVIDEQFATTDAGRVLLEADLEMKRTMTELMDPGSERGKAFWDSLERADDGQICYGWTRFWIEPRPATVREDDDQLYILDAPLKVQIEASDVEWDPPQGDACAGVSEEVQRANTQHMIDTFQPLLAEQVNSAPEYADLRRVYTARVAAEWIKDRDTQRPGAFHDVIGSRDVSDWPARTDWDPRAVFDEYVQLLSTPQYRYEYEFGEQQLWMEINGGIELPDAPRDQTSREDFERDHPRLPGAVQDARHEAVALPPEITGAPGLGTLDSADATTAWLGGGTVQQADEPDPDPTDPPDEPGPTAPPDEPQPTDPPTAGPGDDDGDGDGSGPGTGDDAANGGGPSGPGDDGAEPRPGGKKPEPPRADDPPADTSTPAGTLPATGGADVWLVSAALVLALAGTALLLLRRRWWHRG